MKRLSALLLVLIYCSSPKESVTDTIIDDGLQLEAISLLGDSLYGQPTETSLRKYDSVADIYYQDTIYVENIIWFGRFTAYKKSYNDAIEIFTNGIREFPDDPRLYRHRGHRFISIRKFDQAIRDLAYAALLIEDTENEIEPDGAPNAQNIPVSTLHGNIWYHLGLAYYLKGDWEKALDAYKNCLQSASNHDNVVSSTHWLYMISRNLGDEAMANGFLENIYSEMDIIENFSYHRLCLFYKGLITEDQLIDPSASASSNAAVLYGLGNWHLYNGNRERAKSIYDELLKGSNWDSFGYIAAEADYVNHFLGK